jgi:hypothetical protein
MVGEYLPAPRSDTFLLSFSIGDGDAVGMRDILKYFNSNRSVSLGSGHGKK